MQPILSSPVVSLPLCEIDLRTAVHMLLVGLSWVASELRLRLLVSLDQLAPNGQKLRPPPFTFLNPPQPLNATCVLTADYDFDSAPEVRD